MSRFTQKLPFKINFYTYLRLDLLAAHPHTIDLLKASGIRTGYFGVETLNHASSKSIGKGIRPEKAVETLYKIRESWGKDVRTSAGFIVGLPHETRETATAWLEQITSKDFPLDCLHIYPLFISTLKNKTWKSEFELNYESYGYKFNDKGWYNKHWSADECKQLADRFLVRAVENDKRKLSDFILQSFFNIGYTWEELNRDDFVRNDAEILARINAKTDRYFQNLMNL